MRRNHRIRPGRVRLEATSVCQLHCPACPTASGAAAPTLGQGHLRLEQFRDFLRRNPDIYEIELSNYGEPFLNPELLGILEEARRQRVDLTIDNGANLNNVCDDVLEGLVRYRLRRLTVSIDGATPETYQRYRVGGDFGTVLANIETLNRLKQQHRSRYPRLTWQFIAFPHCAGEETEAKRMARRLHMGFVRKEPWTDSSQAPDSRQEFFKKTGTDIMRGICHQLWVLPQINWDGRVLGCCRNFWGEFGGNAFHDGLPSAANSERMRHARGMLLGQLPPREDIPCTTCDLYLKLRKTGRWLTPGEVRLPERLARSLYRLGIGYRPVLAVAGALWGAGVAARGLWRRGLRKRSTGER